VRNVGDPDRFVCHLADHQLRRIENRVCTLVDDLPEEAYSR